MDRPRAVVIRDLSVAAASEEDGVDGLMVELDAGTLTLVSPRGPGRTLLHCLAGRRAPRAGTIRVPHPPDGRLGPPGLDWAVALIDGGSQAGSGTVAEALDRLGTPTQARSVARRAELTDVLDLPLLALPPGRGRLATVAAALVGAPDILAVEDLLLGLEVQEALELLCGIREFVDLEGRTLIASGDLATTPAGALAMIDRVVEVAVQPV